MKSALKGFLVAPAVPSLLALGIAILQGRFFDGVWWLTILLPISYVASALVGLPIHLLLVRLNRRSLVYYVLAGLAASLAPIFFVFVYPWIGRAPSSQPLSTLYPLIGVMALAGGLVAATFWMIARPDREHLASDGGLPKG